MYLVHVAWEAMLMSLACTAAKGFDGDHGPRCSIGMSVVCPTTGDHAEVHNMW